jgi:phosphohistidine phosphatase
LQHGEAFSEEVDPERSLTPDGESQIKATARALQKMGVDFDLLVTSPKKRARQTAEIVAERLRYPLDEIKVTETLQPTVPAPEAIAFVKAYEEKMRILLAGHLPSLGQIASDLLSEGSPVIIRFNMSGMYRIDLDFLQSGSGELRWALTPEQLKLIAR